MSAVDRAWRGMRSDWRLCWLGIFSAAVAFVCLAAAVLVVVNLDAVHERWAERGRASVYLRPTATTEQIAMLDKALQSSDGVAETRFVSSEEARREVAGNGSDEVLGALPAEAFPASIEVKLGDGGGGDRLTRLAAQLEVLPAVESVETYQAWSERLGSLLSGGALAASLLALLLLGAVVSVIGSTIRLTLQRRRIEVEVLKLVGATDGYVRAPFVIEGAAQGAAGALLGVSLMAILFAIVRARFDAPLVALLGAGPSFLPWPACAALVLLGAGLGAAAAFGSLRRLLVV
jgi:cell division transport system permease protein